MNIVCALSGLNIVFMNIMMFVATNDQLCSCFVNVSLICPFVLRNFISFLLLISH